MIEFKLIDLNNDRIRQQYQTILTLECLKLNEVSIYIIDDSIYYRIAIINKKNELCSKIRDAMLN